MRAPAPPFTVSLGVLLPAVLVLALAYDGGGYSVESRGSWAIATWWAVALGVVLGWWPSLARSPGAKAVVVFLTAFALLTLASGLWSTNNAESFAEFTRVSFYIGAFLLVLQAAPRVPAHRIGDGLAIGVAAVVAVALASRISPRILSDERIEETLPAAAGRLSYPLGYWNGLAILAALAVPLLLRASASPGHPVRRALAAAPLPPIVATIYLASSRGGMATAAIGAAVFLALSRFRWSVVAALVAAATGSALVVAALVSQSQFVNEPTSASTSARMSIGLVLLLGCFISSALHAAFTRVFARVSAPPRAFGIALATTAGALAIVAVTAAGPAERLRAFKRPPAEDTAGSDEILSHLVSAGGSGRWQFWEAALDAWDERLLLGHGAGSYEAWWAQHGTLHVFVRDAHSLYLETLAELGAVGLGLLVATAASVLVASVSRRRRHSADRAADAVAAATAVVIAYAFAAGIDWVWELPVLALIAFTCLAVMLTPTVSASAAKGTWARAALAAIAIVVVVAQAVPYLSQTRIRESQAAVAGGDSVAALAAARAARDIQPWAPEPWLQLALVHEQRGELQPARRAIARATSEDRDDWRLWLVAARLETKLGKIPQARMSLERAIRLNPRSPLFDDLR